ncbi:hypothetical protein AB1Y20_017858 [Prymnesium parvum]|uniref:Protein-tyrosine sulfotransferase n=1 Tax=Prymnesium parvum TaxID=97485 RepID=A0AB34JQB5_PRYPA
MGCGCQQPQRTRDTRTANALCFNQPTPRVAHCIVGAARTFPVERAWRSLRRNLVEAFGGIGLEAEAADVFFHMKLVDDALKAQREWRFDSLSRTDDAASVCEAACAFSPRGVSLLNESHAGPPHPAAVTAGCFRSGFFAHPQNMARAVSQWTSFNDCLGSLSAAEAAAGKRYDLVVLTRPDTIWYGAVAPFCQHDLRFTTVHRGPVRWNSTLEWLLIMPRRHAQTILGTAAVFDSCKPGERCCSIDRSEDLLQFALGRAGPYQHRPFAVDILRPARQSGMRNAGCSQPEALGFRTFDDCRSAMYGTRGAEVREANKPIRGHGGRAAESRSRGSLFSSRKNSVHGRASVEVAPHRGEGVPPGKRFASSPESEPTEDWRRIPASAAKPPLENQVNGACEKTPYVALLLAGPVRSLLTPAVYVTTFTHFWRAFGGQQVLFARLYDVHLLDAAAREKLVCVLSYLAQGHGEWSAPAVSGKRMPSATETAGCKFHPRSELAQHEYMVQSLARQLATLRACFDRLVQYETEHRLTFEWVLRTRTDTAFLSPVLPECRSPRGAVLTAHAYQKGEATLHMFSDHAAIVPRSAAHAFFISVAERLQRCSVIGERLSLDFGAPESFIHHALLAAGVEVQHASWLAPFVVSIDGRMPKWCDRYRKLGVSHFTGFAGSNACSRHFLSATFQEAGSSGPACHNISMSPESRIQSASTPSYMFKRNTTGNALSACTHFNGCCRRHPRSCNNIE